MIKVFSFFLSIAIGGCGAYLINGGYLISGIILMMWGNNIQLALSGKLEKRKRRAERLRQLAQDLRDINFRRSR